MNTKEKKKAHYWLLVLLFLLLGLGIQVGLGYQRLSRGEARSARLLEELSLSAQTAAENETQRRGGLWENGCLKQPDRFSPSGPGEAAADRPDPCCDLYQCGCGGDAGEDRGGDREGL